MKRKFSGVELTCDGDGCGRMATVEDDTQLPDGWYQIRMPDEAGRVRPTGGFDLCSLRCVAKWAKGRQAALGESHTGRYVQAPCPICGDVMSAQGFGQHLKFTHDDLSVEDRAAAKVLFDEARQAVLNGMPEEEVTV